MDAMDKRLKTLGTVPSIGKSVYKDDDGADNQIDRISKLPNELLCHILSFLPTKDAIATAVLSKKWRNLFPMIPNLRLVLSDTSDTNPCLNRGSISSTANFSNFMNRLLRVTLRGVESLPSLALTCQRITNGREIASWLGAALALNLKMLELRVSYLSRPKHLVDQLKGCGLVSLALRLESASKLREYKFNLPNLKWLSVTLTKFAFVNALVEGSPLLERLAIIDCSGEVQENLRIKAPLLVALQIVNGLPNYTGALELDAPNLETLSYRGFMDQHYKLKTLKSLSIALLHAHPNHLQVPFQSNETATMLLTACCDARKLWFSESFVADLIYLQALPHFPNLTVVGMDKMHRNLWPLMFDLLERAPKLGFFIVKAGINSNLIGRKLFYNLICIHFSQRRDGNFILTIQRPAAMASTSSAVAQL